MTKMRRNHLAPALALALLAGPASAGPGEVVDGGMPLVATGKVVAKGPDSLVVRTDDHGHRIAFAVDKATVLPKDVAVGKHVRIVYHALGSTGQAADEVTVTAPRQALR